MADPNTSQSSDAFVGPHPDIDTATQNIIDQMAKHGYTVRVISRKRDAETQNRLYAQGRSAPGPIVNGVTDPSSVVVTEPCSTPATGPTEVPYARTRFST